MKRLAFAILLHIVVGPYWARQYLDAPDGTAWK